MKKTKTIRLKNLAALALCFLMILSVFAGCNEKGNSSGSAGAANSKGNESTGESGAETEPVTLRWFFRAGPTQVLPEDSDICKQIKEDLNITYIHVPTGENSEETLNMMLASNDIPDVISSYQDLTTRLMESELLIPVEQYLTEEYVPNMIKNGNNWDLAVEVLTRQDGHTWAIPSPNPPASMISVTPYIRYDWLEALNLEVPTTFDELADVLIAFAKDDPDGNGKNDTFGTALQINAFDMSYYAEGMAASRDKLYHTDSGDVEYGIFTDRYLGMLKYFNRLITEGAIPADTFSYKSDTVVSMKYQGKIGFSYDYNDYTDICINNLNTVYPDAKFEIMAPPQGAYGKGYLPGTGTLREEHVVTTACEHPEAVFRLLNYMAEDTSTDPQNPTYEGTYWTSRYGPQGKYWDVTEDGAFDYGQFKDTSESSKKIYDQLELEPWAKSGTTCRFRSKFDNAAFLSATGKQLEMNKKALSYEITQQMPDSEKLKPINMEGVILPAEVSEYTLSLEKLEDQMKAESLKAGADVEKIYNDFVTEAKRLGLDEIMVTVNEVVKEYGR